MALSVHIPRINNNDDEVKLVELHVAVGAQVSTGQVIGAVETDKAVMDVEAPGDGFVLAIRSTIGETVRVGSILMWLGATAEEVPPQLDAPTVAGAAGNATPTAKAMALLSAYSLNASEVVASGARLSAEDVRRHVAARGLAPVASTVNAPATRAEAPTTVTGSLQPLQPHERGMLQTVIWQRDFAAPGYIELAYDAAAWDRHAGAFGSQHKLLLSPLLPLMAWRLVDLARQMPKANATIVGQQRHEYDRVNLGFTVQAGEVLYLAVVQDAAALGETGLVNRLVDLQRRAAAHQLTAQETQGATIGFSSMSRWKVARHVPILAPQTALMVAHTVDADGRGVLGATYDHRVLHGADVAALLRKLGTPPAAG